jgi:diacylglycerol kinase (ATP)
MKSFSPRARFKSLKYAAEGLAYLLKTQPNSWIHVTAMAAVIVVGVVLHINTMDWCLIVFAIGFVFAAEAFNTAVEVLTDLVSREYNDKAKIVKDGSAPGVLIAAITAVVIGVVVFGGIAEM